MRRLPVFSEIPSEVVLDALPGDDPSEESDVEDDDSSEDELSDAEDAED